MKFSTALGAISGYISSWISPSVVCSVACVESFKAFGADETAAMVASSRVGFSLKTSRSALLSLDLCATKGRGKWCQYA